MLTIKQNQLLSAFCRVIQITVHDYDQNEGKLFCFQRNESFLEFVFTTPQMFKNKYLGFLLPQTWITLQAFMKAS